jgi:hypothetical protein
MTPVHVIDGLWLAFVLIWLVAAQFNKRASAHAPWKTWVARLAIIALLIGVRLHSGGGSLGSVAGPLQQWSGAALVALGVGFASGRAFTWDAIGACRCPCAPDTNS